MKKRFEVQTLFSLRVLLCLSKKRSETSKIGEEIAFLEMLSTV